MVPSALFYRYNFASTIINSHNQPTDMKRTLIALAVAIMAMTIHAKTLIVYYSYTNNVHNIVTELTKQIEADVIRI